MAQHVKANIVRKFTNAEKCTLIAQIRPLLSSTTTIE